MQAYSGTDPFIFVSYAHDDWSVVEQLIIQMKRNMCRVWYDEGLEPGKSWNDDLAEHLKQAACVVVFLTAKSMESHYVRSEITFALSRGKTIIPVLLEKAPIPIGLEFELGRIQYLNASETGEFEKIYKLFESRLPSEIFAQRMDPFLECDGYAFYLAREDIAFESLTYHGPERVNNKFKIVYARTDNEEKQPDAASEAQILFEYGPGYAYDASYSITQCKVIEDDYFVGSIRGIHIINLLGRFELDYPLTGPDFDVLFVFALRIPRDEEPSIRLIDYQVTRLVQPTLYEDKKLKETAWGGNVERNIQKMLCLPGSLEQV